MINKEHEDDYGFIKTVLEWSIKHNAENVFRWLWHSGWDLSMHGTTINPLVKYGHFVFYMIYCEQCGGQTYKVVKKALKHNQIDMVKRIVSTLKKEKAFKLWLATGNETILKTAFKTFKYNRVYVYHVLITYHFTTKYFDTLAKYCIPDKKVKRYLHPKANKKEIKWFKQHCVEASHIWSGEDWWDCCRYMEHNSWTGYGGWNKHIFLVDKHRFVPISKIELHTI